MLSPAISFPFLRQAAVDADSSRFISNRSIALTIRAIADPSFDFLCFGSSVLSPSCSLLICAGGWGTGGDGNDGFGNWSGAATGGGNCTGAAFGVEGRRCNSVEVPCGRGRGRGCGRSS